MKLADLNYIFECDWLIEQSDNKLSNNKLSNNKLSDEGYRTIADFFVAELQIFFRV